MPNRACPYCETSCIFCGWLQVWGFTPAVTVWWGSEVNDERD